MEKELSKHLMDMNNTNPSIFVSTYAKSERNSLKGVWVDLTTFDTAKELKAFCTRYHCDETDPKFLILDHAGFPEIVYKEKYLPNEEMLKIIKDYAKLDKKERKQYEAFIELFGNTATVEMLRQSFVGEYDSEIDFAKAYIKEKCNMNEIPEFIYESIDWCYMLENYLYDFLFNKGYVFHTLCK